MNLNELDENQENLKQQASLEKARKIKIQVIFIVVSLLIAVVAMQLIR
jgi:hypothetical protein